MAKQTLLELVQNILSDLNSDEVNSINDTVESQQVAEVIKSVYFDIIADVDFPEHLTLKQLTGLSNVDQPNYMQIPSTVNYVEWIKYDVRTTTLPDITYVKMKYFKPEDFLDRVLSNNSSDANIKTVTDTSGVKLLIRNDKHPEFYTSFDDDILVFDSYNSEEESTLTTSRTLVYCTEETTWAASDSFIPNLDSNMFPLLLAEAKSLAFINNTQSSNPKIEQIARRHQSRKQSRKHRVAGQNTWPDFGRK